MSDRRFDYGKIMMAVIILIVAYFAFAISDAFAQVTATTDPPPTVTVSASPLTGRAPLTTTLTWSSTNADTCRRGTEVVPTSGTVQITGVNVDTQYTITCTGGKNYSDVTWLPPPDQLTGVRLANGQCETKAIPATGPEALGGFRLVYNTSLAALNMPAPTNDCGGITQSPPTGTVVNITDPAARSYRVTNQANGDYFYALAALNQAGAISSWAGPATNTINRTSVSATVTVDVTGFATSATPVYNVVKKTNGFVMVVVGSVPLNTPCDRTQTVNGYYAVPISAVTWTGVKSIVVVAQCSEQ